MTTLHDLFDRCGQSPWLDNLSRDAIRGGGLQDWVDKGVRGVPSNPSIFQKAITAGNAYDEQLVALGRGGGSTDGLYLTLAMDVISEAVTVLRPTFDSS